jgi:tetratricopeptide (TPR) repeat protein
MVFEPAPKSNLKKCMAFLRDVVWCLGLLSSACLTTSFPAHAQVSALVEGRALNAEGLRLLAIGRLAEAEAIFERALVLCPGAAPFVANCTSAVLSNLAKIRYLQGDTAAALPLAQRSVAAAEEIRPPGRDWLIARYLSLAAIQGLAGQPAAAEATVRRAIALAEVDAATAPQTLGECLLALITPLLSQGRPAEAVAAGHRGIELLRAHGRASGDRYQEHMVAILNIAVAQAALLRHADAEAGLRDALRYPPPGGTQNEAVRMRLMVMLADAMSRQGKSEAAEQLYREQLALGEAKPLPDVLLARLDALAGLASQLQTTGRANQAEPLLVEAVALARAGLAPGAPGRSNAMLQLGGFLNSQRRLGEAALILEEALATLEVASAGSRQMAETLHAVGALRVAQLRLDPAADFYDRALAIYGALGLGDSVQALDVVSAKATLAIIRGTEAQALPLLQDALDRAVRVRGAATTEYAGRARDLAGAQYATGNFAGAEATLRRALSVHIAVAGESNLTVYARVELGRAIDAQGRSAEAEILFAEAIASAPRLLGAGHAEGDLLKAIGDHLAQAGRFAKADDMFLRAMALFAMSPGRASWRFVEAQDEHARMAMQLGEFDIAERGARASLAIAHELAGPTDMQRAWRHERLAWVLHERALFAEAETEHLAAIAIASGGGADSTLAMFQHQLGLFYVEIGRNTEARARFEQALAIDRRGGGAETERTASYLTAVASVLRRDGQLKATEELVLRGLAIRERLLPADHVLIAESLNALGLLRSAQARFAEAEAPYRRALAIRLVRLGERSRLTAQSMARLSETFMALDQLAPAKEFAKRALAIVVGIHGAGHPNAQFAAELMAEISAAEGAWDRAARELESVLSVNRLAYGDQSRFTASVLESLAELNIARGRLPDAERELTAVLSIRGAMHGADAEHPDFAIPLSVLGQLRLAQGMPVAADALYSRAFAIRIRQSGRGDLLTVPGLYDRATAHLAQDRLPEAALLAAEGRAISSGTSGGRALALRGAVLVAHIASAEGRWEDASAELAAILPDLRARRGSRHPDVAALLEALAGLAIRMGELGDADALLSEALSIRVAVHGSGHVATTGATLGLADLADARGDVALAMAIRARALALREAAFGSDAPGHAALVATLANDHARLGQPDMARAFALRAEELAARSGAPTAQIEMQLMNAKALVALVEHRLDAAEEALHLLRALEDKTLNRSRRRGVSSGNNLGLVLLEQGKVEEAAALLKRALAETEALLGAQHPRLATILFNLAEAERRAGRLTEAQAAIERAIALRRSTGDASGVPQRWL